MVRENCYSISPLDFISTLDVLDYILLNILLNLFI